MYIVYTCLLKMVIMSQNVHTDLSPPQNLETHEIQLIPAVQCQLTSFLPVPGYHCILVNPLRALPSPPLGWTCPTDCLVDTV